jgi:hypothetical protein
MDYNEVNTLLDVIHKSAAAGPKFVALAVGAEFELQAYIAEAKAAADERAKAKAAEEAKTPMYGDPIEVDDDGQVVQPKHTTTNGRRV